MINEQLYRVKNAVVYFVMIGIIVSYLILSISLELDMFKDNIVSIENLRYELFGTFIIMQLIMFFIKLVLNREYGIIRIENLVLIVLFVLEITILYSSIINGINEIYGVGTNIIFTIIEIAKVFVMLTYAISNVLDNFYTNNKNKHFQNNYIGVRND